MGPGLTSDKPDMQENFLPVQGQVILNGHNQCNVLVQRKFYLSKEQISLYLSVLKKFTLWKTV